MLKKIVINFLIATASVSAYSGGYKDIQFGDTGQSLEAKGFKDCVQETMTCFNHTPDSKYTVFGKKVDLLSAEISDGIVKKIGLSGIPMTPREFITLADKSIGKSTKYNYQNFFGDTRTVAFWTLKDGSGITLRYGDGELDGRKEKALFGRDMVLNKTTNVDYVTPTAIADLISSAKKSSKIDKKDF